MVDVARRLLRVRLTGAGSMPRVKFLGSRSRALKVCHTTEVWLRVAGKERRFVILVRTLKVVVYEGLHDLYSSLNLIRHLFWPPCPESSLRANSVSTGLGLKGQSSVSYTHNCER